MATISMWQLSGPSFLQFTVFITHTMLTGALITGNICINTRAEKVTSQWNSVGATMAMRNEHQQNFPLSRHHSQRAQWRLQDAEYQSVWSRIYTVQPSNWSPLSFLPHFLHKTAFHAHEAMSRRTVYKNLKVAGKSYRWWNSSSDTLPTCKDKGERECADSKTGWWGTLFAQWPTVQLFKGPSCWRSKARRKGFICSMKTDWAPAIFQALL